MNKIQNAWGCKVSRHRIKANGISLNVVTAGSGYPIVFIHGWPQTSYCWRKLFPELCKNYSLIAPDLRGFADSDKPADGYDKRTCAEDMKDLLKALGHRKAVFVGHDIGARVAFRLAIDHPECVERLVIISGRYPPLGTTRMFEPKQALERWYFLFHQIPNLPEELVSKNVHAYIKHFLLHWAHRKAAFTSGDIEEYIRAFSRPGALRGGFNHYRAAMNQDVPQWKEDEGKVLDVRMMVLWGRNDPVSPPEWTDGYPRAFSNMSLKFIDECGHYAHEEQPKSVLKEMTQFLSDLSGESRMPAIKAGMKQRR